MVGLLLSACIAVQTPNAVKPEIRAVSVFRNGYAVVLRDIALKPGDNMLEELPQAMAGTLLFLPDKGVNVEEVVSTLREMKQEANATSLDDLLSLGVGKNVKLNVRDIGIVEGTIVSADGTIVMVSHQGRLLAVNKASIFGVNLDGSVDAKRRWTSHTRALRFRSRTGGKLVMLSVEGGMNWSPSYAIDISDPKRLTVTGKAIIVNGFKDLNEVTARLVTGYPNMSFSGQVDPLVMADVGGIFAGNRGGSFTRVPADGGMIPKGIDHISYDPSDNSLVVRGGEAFENADVEQAEDLFYYSIPQLTMKVGDRSYRTLMETTATYEHLYTWYVPNTITADYRYNFVPGEGQPVWHNLKFTNASDTAWTMAHAIIIKNRDILAQSILPYTSKNQETSVALAKAMDVKPEHSEEEVTRERTALTREKVVYDLITLKATIVVTNRKSEAVHIKISKDLSGEVITTTGNPVVTKTVAGLRDINGSASVVWERDIPAGGKTEVSFTYKVYVRTQ